MKKITNENEAVIKNRLNISTIIMTVVIAIIVLVICFTAKLRFSSTYNPELKEEAVSKMLEFHNGFNSEMALASQMAKSPVIVAYMENPENEELAALGIKEIESYQNSFKSHITFWIGDKDLKYYSNGNYIYTLDKSDPTSAWYLNCMKLKGDYELNVDYDIGLKVTNVWVNAVVRNKNGEAIGLIGTGISLDSFISEMYETLNPKFTMYMYNKLKETTASLDSSHLENKTPITEVIPAIADKSIMPETETVISTRKGNYMIVPMPELGWYMLLFKPFTVGDFFKVSIIQFIVLILAVAFWVIILTLNHLITPLGVLQATVEGIANGNADLTKRIELKTKSSMKVLQKLVASFNQFVGKLQTIIKSVKSSKDELIASGTELHDGTTLTTDSINGIITNVKSFADNLQIQSNGVEETASSVNNLYSNFERLENSVKDQASSVEQAATAVETMIEDINLVNSSVVELSTSFESLKTEASLGVKKQEEVSEKIQKIKEQSEILQSANEIIASIAEQTNLLAMNAAIEAAHAGEAGKGFSVVADEIRKLSETSSEQSNTIGEQLATIQASIESIAQTSFESQDTFNSVSDDIKKTNEVVTAISNAMDRQTSSSNMINGAIDVLNSSMSNIKDATAEMSGKSRQILDEMNNLQNATYNMKLSMEEMSAGTEKISETGSHLAALADSVDDSIKKIGDEIDQFNV